MARNLFALVLVLCLLSLAAAQQPAPPAVSEKTASRSGVAPQQVISATPGAAPSNETAQIVIPDGTPVRLSLVHPLTSKTAKVGEPVEFRVAEPVVINGVVVIPRRAKVLGKVSEVKKPGTAGGTLGIMVERLQLSETVSVPLRGEAQKTGRSAPLPGSLGFKGLDFLFIELPIDVFLTLFTPGEHAVAPPGVLVSAYVNGEVGLNRELVLKLAADPGIARVWVYMPETRLYRMLCSDCSKPKKKNDPKSAPLVAKPVYVGWTEAGQLTFGAYMCLELGPGHYWLHSSGKEAVETDVTSGQDYYVRMTQSAWGKGKLELVSAEAARSEMAELKRELPAFTLPDDPHLRDKSTDPRPAEKTDDSSSAPGEEPRAN